MGSDNILEKAPKQMKDGLVETGKWFEREFWF